MVRTVNPELWYGMGIDPGVTGGVAIVRCDLGDAAASRWPGDEYKLADFLKKTKRHYDVRLCVMEKVASMPRDAKKAAFTFGENNGMWRAGLAYAGIPVTFMTPTSWMNAAVDAQRPKGRENREARKEFNLAAARRMFPNVPLKFKADGGAAEALLMATCAIKKVQGLL